MGSSPPWEAYKWRPPRSTCRRWCWPACSSSPRATWTRWSPEVCGCRLVQTLQVPEQVQSQLFSIRSQSSREINYVTPICCLSGFWVANSNSSISGNLSVSYSVTSHLKGWKTNLWNKDNRFAERDQRLHNKIIRPQTFQHWETIYSQLEV